MSMRARTLAMVSAALAAVLLGACTGESGADGSAPSPTTEAQSAPPPVPSPVLPTLPPAPSLPPRNGELTLTGEVVAGVEPGCRLLVTGSGDYLLFGEPSEQLQVGATVTLRGQVRPDMMTTCQQGTPFEVLEALD
jgi:hypothetical protein